MYRRYITYQVCKKMKYENTHNNNTQGIYPRNSLQGKPTKIGALPFLLYNTTLYSNYNNDHK